MKKFLFATKRFNKNCFWDINKINYKINDKIDVCN